MTDGDDDAEEETSEPQADWRITFWTVIGRLLRSLFTGRPPWPY
jgi:hypothetical protein